MRSPQPVVLLVEDNPADVDLTCEALSDATRAGGLHVVRDGVEAVAFLRREGDHAGAPIPDLVLLDLNLPRLDGRDVLVAMKRDASLKRIPVVVLTSSSAPDDASGAYEAGANCFVTKPVGLTEYLAAVRAIEHFWLGVATLPQ
jgi:two-component system, chemotaxis family, response regulator Rcp1